MSAPKSDCYEYVRGYYGVPAYIGVRVRLRNGREGTLVPAKHSQHYVHVHLDGAPRSDVYHPTDGVEYILIGLRETYRSEDRRNGA